MSLENYTGSAIDTSILEEVQSSAEPEQMEEVAETIDPQEEGIATQTEQEVDEPTKEEELTEVEVPGIGKLTVDEIKEMRQGGLRQADYTRKTQELARQREELQNAEELFNHLKANPHIVEAMKQADNDPNSVVRTASPESEMIQRLAYSQKAMEVDMKLNELKSKYGDIDEVALFRKANELNTDDLEFVYQGLRYESGNVNVDEIVAKAKEEAKAELKAELEKNQGAVSTIVDTRQSQPVTNVTPLTPAQKRVADAMGMSEDEYRKWL